MIFSLWLLLSSLAFSKDSAQQILFDDALRKYHSGEKDTAMQKFLSLSYNDEVSLEIRQEADIYIGEILYFQNDLESARRIFEQLLRKDPTYQIDRFRHPPEVCTYFDYVKSSLPVIKLPPPPKINSFPVSGYAPFGVYQLRYDKTWKGYTYLGTQTLAATTSIALLVYLNNNNRYNENDLARKNMLQTSVYVQQASTVLFYTLWLGSAIDAQRHWRIEISKNKETASFETEFHLGGRF
ncbi:MAG: hypothetical protein VX278_12150 [Myxococcota bacterium]|nr:hypothetical protein [Myxococcota bacterium]